MISIYKIKPKFQQLLLPILRWLYERNFSANQITISAILLSGVIGICFWNADVNRLYFLFVPIGLFVRMALNALDGMMARVYNMQSKLGEMLNELGDIVADLFIYFPLLKFEKNNIYSVVIFLCLCIINEFSGVLAKVIGGERRYDGPMGKSDRAFLIGLYGLLSFFQISIASYAFYIFTMVNMMLLVSTYLRLKNALK